MKNILALTIFALSGCGPAFSVINNAEIDPAFIPYVQTFLFEAEKHGYAVNKNLINGISMHFSNEVVLPQLAFCRIYRDNLEIHVLKNKWEDSNTAARELLIYHELGHCIMGKQHNDANIILSSLEHRNDNFGYTGPASIMNSHAIPSAWYAGNREQYLTEFFNNIMPTEPMYYNAPSQIDPSMY
jgi:hypothetical protein